MIGSLLHEWISLGQCSSVISSKGGMFTSPLVTDKKRFSGKEGKALRFSNIPTISSSSVLFLTGGDRPPIFWQNFMHPTYRVSQKKLPFWNFSIGNPYHNFGPLWTIWTTLDHFGPLWTIWTTSLVMMRECPCSTKTREVLENPSPPPSRYPSTVGFGGARIQCCLNRPMSITVYLAQFAAWIKELKTNKSSNIFVPLTTWQRFSEKGICLYLTPLCWAIFNPSTTSTGPEFPGIIMLKAIPFLTASSTHKTPPTTTAFKARSKKSFHFVRNCKRS